MVRIYLLFLLAFACSTGGVRWSREVNSYTENTSDWVPCTSCNDENKNREVQSRSLEEEQPSRSVKRQAVAESRALSDFSRPIYRQPLNYLGLGSTNVETVAQVAPSFGQVVPKAQGFNNFATNFGHFGAAFGQPNFAAANFAPAGHFRNGVPQSQYSFESSALPANFNPNINYNPLYQFVRNEPSGDVKFPGNANRFVDGYRADNNTYLNRPPKVPDSEEVQLLYVPLDTLNKNNNRFKASNLYRGNIPIAEQINDQLRETNFNPFANIISSTLQPDFYTTAPPLKPKLKAHQPPLAMFAEINEVLNREGLTGALKKLKRSQSISVLDNFDAVNIKPEIFVGPNSMRTPRNYRKFDLPYISGGQAFGRNMFVAPLSYKTPDGFTKIPLPQPHVGSLVFNLTEDEKINTVSYFTTESSSHNIEENENSPVSIEPQAVTPLRRPPRPPFMYDTIEIRPKPVLTLNTDITKIPMLSMPLMHTTKISDFRVTPVITQNSTPKQSSSNPFSYPTTRATQRPISSYYSTTLLGPKGNFFPFQEMANYRDKGHYITKFPVTTPSPASSEATRAPPSRQTVDPYPWSYQPAIPVAVAQNNEEDQNENISEKPQSQYVPNFTPDFALPNKVNELGQVSSTIDDFKAGQYEVTQEVSTLAHDQPQKLSTVGQFESPQTVSNFNNFKQPEVHTLFAPSVSPFEQYEQQEVTPKLQNLQQQSPAANQVNDDEKEIEEYENNYKFGNTLASGYDEIKATTAAYNKNSVVDRGQSKNKDFYTDREILRTTSEATPTSSTTTRRSVTRGRNRVSSLRTSTEIPEEVSSTTKKSYRERKPSSYRRPPALKTDDIENTTSKSSRNVTSSRTRGRVQFKSDSDDIPRFVSKRKKNKNEETEEIAYQRDVLHQNYPVTLTERMSTSGIYESGTERTRQITKSDIEDSKASSTGGFVRVSSKSTGENSQTADSRVPLTESYKEATIGFSKLPSSDSSKTYSTIERASTSKPILNEQIPYFNRQAIFESTTKQKNSDFNESDDILKSDQNVEIPKIKYEAVVIKPTERNVVDSDVTTNHEKDGDKQVDEFRQLIRSRNKFKPFSRTKIEDTFTEKSIVEIENEPSKDVNIKAVTYRPAYKRDRTTMKIEDIRKDHKTKMLVATHNFKYPVYKPEKDIIAPENKEETTTLASSVPPVFKPFRSYSHRRRTTTTTPSSSTTSVETDTTTEGTKVVTRGRYRARITSRPSTTENPSSSDADDSPPKFTSRFRASTQSYKRQQNEGKKKETKKIDTDSDKYTQADVDAGQSVIVQKFIPFDNDVTQSWSPKLTETSFKPSFLENEFGSARDYVSSENDDNKNAQKPSDESNRDAPSRYDYNETDDESDFLTSEAESDITDEKDVNQESSDDEIKKINFKSLYGTSDYSDIVTGGERLNNILVEVTPSSYKYQREHENITEKIPVNPEIIDQQENIDENSEIGNYKYTQETVLPLDDSEDGSEAVQSVKKTTPNNFYIPPTLDALSLSMNDNNNKQIVVQGVPHSSVDVESVLDEAMKFLEKQDEKEYYEDNTKKSKGKNEKISSIEDSEVVIVARKPKRRGFWKRVNKKPILNAHKEHLELSESQYYGKTFNDISSKNKDELNDDVFGMKIPNNHQDEPVNVTDETVTVSAQKVDLSTIESTENTSSETYSTEQIITTVVTDVTEPPQDSSSTTVEETKQMDVTDSFTVAYDSSESVVPLVENTTDKTGDYEEVTENKDNIIKTTIVDIGTGAPSFDNLYDMITEKIGEMLPDENNSPRSQPEIISMELIPTDLDFIAPEKVQDFITNDREETTISIAQDSSSTSTTENPLDTESTQDLEIATEKTTIPYNDIPNSKSEATEIKEVRRFLNGTLITKTEALQNEKLLDKKNGSNNELLSAVGSDDEKDTTETSETMWQAEFFSTSKSTEVSHEAEICFRGKCIKTTEKDYMLRR